LLEEAGVIQATIAIYPLGQADYAAVDAAIEVLRAAGVAQDVRSMHTEIVGDDDAVFTALRDAFRAAAVLGGVVMTVAISNACPVPSRAAPGSS
jgi:uncharacterized protein YqgV (UPF0045/DUF77 family)